MVTSQTSHTYSSTAHLTPSIIEIRSGVKGLFACPSHQSQVQYINPLAQSTAPSTYHISMTDGKPVPLSLDTIPLSPSSSPSLKFCYLAQSTSFSVPHSGISFRACHLTILISYLDGSIRGFAYIEFESADDAAEAIFNMNDSELYNRVIKVDIAKPHRGIGGLDSSLPGIFPRKAVVPRFLEIRCLEGL